MPFFPFLKDTIILPSSTYEPMNHVNTLDTASFHYQSASVKEASKMRDTYTVVSNTFFNSSIIGSALVGAVVTTVFMRNRNPQRRIPFFRFNRR